MLVEHALERDSQRTEYYAQTKSAFSQTAHIVSKQKWIVRFLLCRNGTVFHFSSFFVPPWILVAPEAHTI